MTKRKFSLAGDTAFETVKTILAILIALAITFCVLALTCEDPVSSFITMLTGPLTKMRYFGNVLESMVPLVFSGLACSLLFRTGLFNLGIEGIYYIGGVICSYITCQAFGNSFTHPLVAILVPALISGLLMLIPGYLKAKFNANELVTSLMLNSIYLGVGLWFIKTYLRATDYSSTASPLFEKSATLPYIIPGTRVTIGIVLAVVAVLLIYIMLFKTRLGYQIRMTGLNPKFARYSGMNAMSLFLLVHFISGFLGGVGTSVELLSIYSRFSWVALPGLGFNGALMAMMARNNPIGVLVVAFGISYLQIGAEIMSRSTTVPVEVISIVTATLVLLISAQYFLRGWREKKLLKEGLLHV